MDDPLTILSAGMASAHRTATEGLNRLALGLADIPRTPEASHSCDQDAIEAAESLEKAARKLRAAVAVHQHLEGQA